ncbi:MAG TPA: hypothetical protein P5317_07595, partial [Myxococcota bacterium]|nr:hypothetical protein [Myxococcota bacterium]
MRSIQIYFSILLALAVLNISAQVSALAVPTPYPTATPWAKRYRIVTETPTWTPSPASTFTPTLSPSATTSQTSTSTPFVIPTSTDAATAAVTDTSLPTDTGTPTNTDTATPAPTDTPVPTATDTATATDTDTPAPTDTGTITDTPVPTVTDTPTSTATDTPTPTSTDTPTPTDTATSTPTFTSTTTPTPTPIFCFGTGSISPSSITGLTTYKNANGYYGFLSNPVQVNFSGGFTGIRMGYNGSLPPAALWFETNQTGVVDLSLLNLPSTPNTTARSYSGFANGMTVTVTKVGQVGGISYALINGKPSVSMSDFMALIIEFSSPVTGIKVHGENFNGVITGKFDGLGNFIGICAQQPIPGSTPNPTYTPIPTSTPTLTDTPTPTFTPTLT